jgi:hypothetical protein
VCVAVGGPRCEWDCQFTPYLVVTAVHRLVAFVINGIGSVYCSSYMSPVLIHVGAMVEILGVNPTRVPMSDALVFSMRETVGMMASRSS